MESDSEIGNFYRERSVFITGATGFMGKVLVEKLLRSCNGIKHIYVLLRPKKGVDVESRLQKLFEAKLFDKIKESEPNALYKVVAVAGDITSDGLGISDTDLLALTEEVSIVFHSAATVRFDEPLKTAVDQNVLGTRRVIELCHKLPKIVALIHVSTAYANCDRYEVEECVYRTPVPPQNIIDFCDWMTDDQLSAITPSLLSGRPNTYTYTKALAETLLIDECSSLPVAIVRPSIVTASWKEPMPGWVDNLNGLTGVAVATGKGILRHGFYKSNTTMDIIPVDTVINLMITLVWYTATQRPKSCLVYNCTSGSLNGMSWDLLIEQFDRLLEYPSAQIFRYPRKPLTECRLLYKFGVVFDHIIPAYLFDGLMTVLGRKRSMVRIYEMLHKSMDLLGFVLTKEWRFSVDNILVLNNQLKGKDKNIFHFDIRDIHWPTYWLETVLGIRQYILKERNDTLPAARHNLRKIYYIEKIYSLMIVLTVYSMYKISRCLLDEYLL